MGTKRQLLDDPKSCLNKARDDAEVFLLKDTDKFAPEVVRYWAYLASGGNRLAFELPPQAKPLFPNDKPGSTAAPYTPPAMSPKVASAFATADKMEQYPYRKYPD